jgi:glycosyltransferase involved in cell wall biosynthesis
VASPRGRLCFHAPYAYPLLSGGRVPFAGGAEVQQILMGRGLAARGFDIRIATCDFGQPPRVETQGMTLLRTYPPFGGTPVLRFFHPRLTSTVAALRAADAEVYYVRGGGLPAGVAYDVARLRGAAFVLGAAHDHDARRSLPLLGNPRDRWWYRRALRGAATVVAQTEFQRELFARELGRSAEVIPNLVEIPARGVDPGRAGHVTWLATYKAAKRPEWFVELARRLPQLRFVMRGVIPVPPETRAAWEAAQHAARDLPQLEVHDYLDHDRLGELWEGTALLVHTSAVEGFPNTVLEAWAHGVPTITAVDPGGVVSREGVGEVAADLPSLVAAVARWMERPEERRAAGARARAYVERVHAPEPVLDRIGSMFDRLVAEVRARRAVRGLVR